MLEYLFDEEKKNTWNTKFNPKKDWPSKNLDLFEQKRIGFTVRTMAYTILLCTIEKDIKRQYLELQKNIKQLHCTDILPLKTDQYQLLKSRDEEIEEFKNWRNKIFAHTAYGSSKKDNISTQLNSVKYLYGTIGPAIGEKSFYLGGNQACLMVGKKLPKLPKIDIIESHIKIKKHFTEWEKMFVDLLEKLQKIDKEDLKRKNKWIKDITFK